MRRQSVRAVADDESVAILSISDRRAVRAAVANSLLEGWQPTKVEVGRLVAFAAGVIAHYPRQNCECVTFVPVTTSGTCVKRCEKGVVTYTCNRRHARPSYGWFSTLSPAPTTSIW